MVERGAGELRRLLPQSRWETVAAARQDAAHGGGCAQGAGPGGGWAQSASRGGGCLQGAGQMRPGGRSL